MSELITIARMVSGFREKFGIPRQSGRVSGLRGKIVFEPEYRNPEALRGLEGFSHIWLLWGFSEAQGRQWSPTVRPPKLGGNRRMGVFATRSPFRPNAIGLSCVEIERMELETPEGPVLHVLGADLMDGTPVYDIKPYLPQADCRPEAAAGFAGAAEQPALQVYIPKELLSLLPAGEWEILRQLLAEDPRPGYQQDPERVYGMRYGNVNVKFTVSRDMLTVVELHKD